jgi:SpoIID/LytB domain protein
MDFPMLSWRTARRTSGLTTALVVTLGLLLPAPAHAATPPQVTGVKVKAGQHSARLTWPKVAGATSYDVCVYAARTSKSCTRWAGGITSATTLVKDLKPTKDTDYYAQVRAVSGAAKGRFSALKGFNLSASSPVAVQTKSITPSSVNSVTVPSSRKITVQGHGYGHGIGMSQYGAQGAARQGLTYDAILSTYYPGTALAKKSGSIRVLISQDTSDAVDVKAGSGLVFRKLVSSFSAALPTTIGGAKVKSWRIVRVSSRKTQSMLQYRTTGGYHAYKNIRWTGDGQFEGPSRISLLLPGGSVVKYRGAIRSAVPSKGSTARDTVNVLPIEHYVRGVIAAEMPAGWAPEALKAQAVAARTYGVRSLVPSRYYDICSTTACQVYGGASRETAATDAAARTTSGQYVTYQGAAAFTQFSSSSGGRTSVGSQPYLVAGPDPYDGWSGNANHSWTTTVSASTIQKAYPAIGTLNKLTITKRSGGGSWGGRVSSIDLVGSRSTKTITGNDARWAFGLKSNWFGF